MDVPGEHTTRTSRAGPGAQLCALNTCIGGKSVANDLVVTIPEASNGTIVICPTRI